MCNVKIGISYPFVLKLKKSLMMQISQFLGNPLDIHAAQFAYFTHFLFALITLITI
jgi:hypothetical protein